MLIRPSLERCKCPGRLIYNRSTLQPRNAQHHLSPSSERHGILNCAKHFPAPYISHCICTWSYQRIVIFASTIMVLLASSAFALMLVGLVNAASVKRQAIAPLSSGQISSYTPFTYFASTAYCNPSTTINWSCGGASRAPHSAHPMQP